MSKVYFREQKHICGSSYDTAGYMEVDLYQISEKEHKHSTRRKKQNATELAQQCYNDSRSKRYHVQLVNTNFKQGDYSVTLTYNDEHLPDPSDHKRADDDWSNYIKRLYRYCRRHGIKRPKWVMATEYATEQEDGSFVGRHHHHAIIEKTEGLTREILEDLWTDRNGDKLGMCRCDRLEVEHGSVESLVKYINKNKRCDRSWRQSRGLQKPITPKPNDTKWNKKRLEEASTMYIDDKQFWADKYPGYTLERVETKVSDAGYRHTLVIMYRIDGKKGRKEKWIQ
jgi:hypothetical protein